jgi:hypothetical protein
MPWRPGRTAGWARRRAAQHGVEPDARFHYRYRAADLAWQAVSLMPDGTDETARRLCVAGSWLKDRDPAAADRFYRALVRRCGQTALGRQAETLRWFPKSEIPERPPVQD